MLRLKKLPQDVNFWNGNLIHRMSQAFHLLYFVAPRFTRFRIFRGPFFTFSILFTL